jgi:hypothetical protein
MTLFRWRLPRSAFWLALPALLACSARHADAVPGARTFYVDFDRGSDLAEGASASQPWRHAPGDPQAESAPARLRLGPGDTVLFRGGVVYRGEVIFRASGAAGAPITYRGEGFGPGKAIISGRDVVAATVRPCASTPACAGLANAKDLEVIQLPSAVDPSDQIVLGGHMLEVAQTPQLPDPFWYDDLKQYQPVPQHDLSVQGASWKLRSGFISHSLGARPVEDLVVHLWGIPNAVTSVPVTGYDPASGEIRFETKDFSPYTDRDSKFALVNHPALIRRPFQYATIARGTAIVVQASIAPGPVSLEISRRGLAFAVDEQKHIAIEGFEITGFAGGAIKWGWGSALRVQRGAEDIALRRSDIHDLTSWAGAGTVSANGVTGLAITDNHFTRLWRGDGVLIGGKASDVRILRNTFDHIGRTGIAVFGADRVWIDRNRLNALSAHHGNGISIYLDNHDVLVSNNLVQLATRALTFHGKSTGINNLVFRRNLFRAFTDDGVALQSWSGADSVAGDVRIEGNVLLVDDGRFALKLNANDTGVVVRGNLIDGLLVRGDPTGWVMRDNVFTAENYAGSADAFASLNRSADGLRKPGAKLFGEGVGTPDPGLCRLLLSASDDGATLNWLPPEERKTLSTGVGPDGLCGG